MSPSTPPDGDPRFASTPADRRGGEARSADGRGTGKRGPVSSAVEIVAIVAAAFILALVIQQFVVKPFVIQQVSMLPTLHEGDRVLVNRFWYEIEDPERGDIVVLQTAAAGTSDLVKRVVGVEGDVVAVEAGRVILNGEPLDEPYLSDGRIRSDMEELVVPPDHVFVMGDNRNSSSDSRAFGPVPKDDLLGEAFLIYWPLSRVRVL